MDALSMFVQNLQTLLAQRAESAMGSSGAVGSSSSASVAGTESSAVSGSAVSDSSSGQHRDAIDAELSRPTRATAVVSLRDAPEMAAFRQEWVDGLIRVDTANQLLRLLNELITRALV